MCFFARYDVLNITCENVENLSLITCLGNEHPQMVMGEGGEVGFSTYVERSCRFVCQGNIKIILLVKRLKMLGKQSDGVFYWVLWAATVE